MQPRFDIILKKKIIVIKYNFGINKKIKPKNSNWTLWDIRTLSFFFHYYRVPFMLGMQALKY